jgi:iron complex transport system permease protein
LKERYKLSSASIGVRAGGLSKTKIIVLVAVPLAVFFCSLFIGRYWIHPIVCLKVLASRIIPIEPTWAPMVETVVFQLRLPRALLALFIGSGLSISGASFQGMFRNPLVSPDILGVSAAAGFGACIGILLGTSDVTIQLLSFAFGILGVGMAYMMSRIYKTTPVLMLVLAGVVVAAFFSALISVTKIVADPYSKLPTITFWLMGSLGTASLSDLIKVVPFMVLGTLGLLLVSWRINLLSMGDEEARAMGVRTELLKVIIVVCATVITAAAVSVAGIIGWVGLIIPHICRMVAGPNHRTLLPVSLSVGAAYLLAIDVIARTATPMEIPLGILTAVIGAPFFAFLLRKTKGAWA